MSPNMFVVTITWNWRARITGTYHVLVASWQPASLRVDRQGSTIQTASPYEALLTNRGWTTQSAAARIEAGESLDVTVGTRGCFSVYIYSE
jgi:hypothetical protein